MRILLASATSATLTRMTSSKAPSPDGIILADMWCGSFKYSQSRLTSARKGVTESTLTHRVSKRTRQEGSHDTRFCAEETRKPTMSNCDSA